MSRLAWALFWVPGWALLMACAPARPGTASLRSNRDADGILTYMLPTPCQRGPVAVQVILPEPLEPGRRYPVLYILPVYAGTSPKASGITEARRLNLSVKYGLICVAPSFDACPWYADHPTDPHVRQESHLLQVVIPFVERTFPAEPDARGRMLVGFSKSGWGAFSLLLRHPDVFGRASAWDGPWMLSAPDRWETELSMATRENFERYRIMGLLERRASLLQRTPPRLALMGYSLFREETEAAHRRMDDLAIPHLYDNAVHREHNWTSGWLEPAVQALIQMDQASTTSPVKHH